MSDPATAPEVVRFSEFVLDLRSGELARNGGERVLLPGQPFLLLKRLLRQPGALITRDSLRHELWADDTFVDFERGLNAAMRRLREALGDSAVEPRFIETLPRRGYRFIAHIDGNGALPPATTSPANDAPVLAVGPSRSEPLASTPGRRAWLSWRALAITFAAAVLLFVAAAGARSFAPLRHDPAPVIAVLPFSNLSVEPESEYFVDGLTDEIIRNLAVIDGLEVRSRTSSFTFKNKPRNTREVGAALQASLVLEGSVLRQGDKLRINAQLVRVADDVPLWSGRFDRELKDVFAIQDEISRSIVNELRLKLGRGQRRYSTTIEAYDLFLKARVLEVRRGDGVRRAVDLFTEVVEKDPGFAPAYAGLASAMGEASFYFPSGDDNDVAPDHAAAVMRSAAFRAIELDPLLAEAHAALGQLHAFEGEWAEAEGSFRRALELNPSLTTTYTNFVLSTLFPEGKLEQAMERLEAALRVDPLSLDVRRVLANVQISAGLYDRALDNAQKVLAVDPTFPFVGWIRARALLQKGQVTEAVRWLEGQGPDVEGCLGYAYAISGRRAEAEVLAARNEYADNQSVIYAGLGDRDRAFEALRRFAALNRRRAGIHLTHPELANLRGDPRMAALRAQLGLPPSGS